MRKITLFIALITSLSLFSQEYNDLIITNSNDTINCKITLVNEYNIFYNYLKKKNENSTMISLGNVLTYSSDGSKIEVIKKSVVVIEDKTPTNSLPINTDFLKYQNKQTISLTMLIIGSGLFILAAKESKMPFYYAAGAFHVIGFAISFDSLSNLKKSR